MDQTSDTPVVCDVCGAELVVGAWPFCHGDPANHTVGTIHGLFDPFRPYVDEHILPNGKDIGLNHSGTEMVRGTRIESREHRRAIMKAEGLDWNGRRVGQKHCEV